MPFDLSNMPARVAALPRDRRGLPIPVIVMRDGLGEPHFTMNDTRTAARLFREGGCGICGQRLGAYKCFVGGPGSAFHPQGRYFDGPVHLDCAEFALHACPYLALAGSYAKRIGDRTLRPEAIPQGAVLIAEDRTSHAPQPAVFVLGSCKRFTLDSGGHFVPERPWAQVRFFRAGQEITGAEARQLAEADPTPAAPFSDLKWQDR
jgi:hypothetical protein